MKLATPNFTLPCRLAVYPHCYNTPYPILMQSMQQEVNSSTLAIHTCQLHDMTVHCHSLHITIRYGMGKFIRHLWQMKWFEVDLSKCQTEVDARLNLLTFFFCLKLNENVYKYALSKLGYNSLIQQLLAGEHELVTAIHKKR